MTALPRRLKAVRFDMPFDADEDRVGRPSGLRLTASGSLALAEDAAAIRQAIMMLLSTRPGERLMRPEYGCPLHRLAFEPNDAATAGLAMHYIRTALARWEPRVEIIALVAESNAADREEGVLAVRLEYRVRANGEFATMQFDLDLQGREAHAISRS